MFRYYTKNTSRIKRKKKKTDLSNIVSNEKGRE
jgi:hypothetical protein